MCLTNQNAANYPASVSATLLQRDVPVTHWSDRNRSHMAKLQDEWLIEINNNNIYLLQLGCHPVAVFILHVNKT